MEIKNFKVVGRHVETKRKRTIELVAFSKENALELANEQNLIEIIEVVEYVRSPSESQIDYAKKLNIKIPQGSTLQDVSALIDKKLNGDSEPKANLIEYANERKLCFSKYIGEDRLYSEIYDSFNGVDRIAFFILSIYKSVKRDYQINLEKHIYKNKFYQLSSTLKDDEQFLKSLRYYDGVEYNGFIGGSSTNTIAYKKVVDFLRKESLINKTNNVTRKTNDKNPGCLVFLMIGLSIPVLYQIGAYLLTFLI